MYASPGEEEVLANAPNLDFLWKEKDTFYREPVKIADYENENPIEVFFLDDKFAEALKPSKEAKKQILFVDAIGLYKTGKTTTHKALTRNTAHVSGNAIREETHGIFIDGPYEISYLMDGFGMKPMRDLGQNSPHIYFLDIEGFGGFKNASNADVAVKLYQKLAIPFIGLSLI